MISIKEVTKQTGITVRTMRHYDHIGLLPPANKTEGGHRLYGKKELKKLQEIQFLKTLGFSLQEIKEMLSDENRDWFVSLQNQLDYISKEKETFGDREEFLVKLWEIRKSPEYSEKVGFYPIELEILEFVEKATKLYLNGEST